MKAAERAADLPRRGLRRDEAAAYVGVSPSTFDRWIGAGLMPKSKKIGDVVIWDRFQLDIFFDALPDETGPNPWARVK